jgi:hypothetical protein
MCWVAKRWHHSHERGELEKSNKNITAFQLQSKAKIRHSVTHTVPTPDVRVPTKVRLLNNYL